MRAMGFSLFSVLIAGGLYMGVSRHERIVIGGFGLNFRTDCMIEYIQV